MTGKLERKHLDKPDETRAFEDGNRKLNVVTVGDHAHLAFESLKEKWQRLFDLTHAPDGGSSPTKLARPRKLTEWDLRTIAEVTSEMAKFRGAGFDAYGEARAFTRAAQVDADFRARLEAAARRIEARRAMKMPLKLLVPLASLFRDLERDAERITQPDLGL
jgi:hypothetical protein